MLARGPHAHDVHAHAHAHVAVVDRVLVLRWRAGSRRARRWPVAGRRQAVVGLCAAAHQAHTRTAGHTHRRAGTHAHARVSAREHTRLGGGEQQPRRLAHTPMDPGQRPGTLGAVGRVMVVTRAGLPLNVIDGPCAKSCVDESPCQRQHTWTTAFEAASMAVPCTDDTVRERPDASRRDLPPSEATEQAQCRER